MGATFLYATPDQLEAITMGDIIGVLKEGEIQQIGNMQDIFDYPANEFVASFTGDPPMNLFDCTVKEKRGELFAATKDFTFPIPKKTAKLLEGKELEIKAGIRPDEISIADGGQYTISARVFLTEYLGRHTIMSVKINKILLKLKIRGEIKTTLDTNINIKLNPDKLRFFDKKTGVHIG